MQSGPVRLRFALLSQAWPADPGVFFTGSSVQAYYVARELVQRGHSVLVTLSEHREFETFEDGSLRVVSMPRPKGGLTGILLGRWRRSMIELLKEFQPDVVYQRGKLSATIIAASYARKSHATFVWLSNADNSGQRWKFLKKSLAKNKDLAKLLPRILRALVEDMFIERAVRRADLAVAQTEVQRQEVASNFGLQPVVIGSGHRIPGFAEKTNARPAVLWLANLTPVKNPTCFVRLARDLASEKANFVMAGRPANEQILNDVVSLAKGLRNFDYRGGVGLIDGNALFGAADIFVLTSRFEGLPNTLVQAAMHGVPIISLRNDPDGIIQEHSIGAVVESYEELAATVQDWIRDPRRRREAGKRAYAFAKENFDIETVVDQLLGYIKESMTAPGSPRSLSSPLTLSKDR